MHTGLNAKSPPNSPLTWVSLEPILDTNASIAIVRATHRFVDLFEIGRVNYLPMTKTTDWQDYTLRMIDLPQRLDATHYIKRDLTAGDILHILKFGFVHDEPEPSTQPTAWKYRMECVTPNSGGRTVRIVVIPFASSCDIKVVTVMWADERF